MLFHYQFSQLNRKKLSNVHILEWKRKETRQMLFLFLFSIILLDFFTSPWETIIDGLEKYFEWNFLCCLLCLLCGWGCLSRCQIFKQNQNISIRSRFIWFLVILPDLTQPINPPIHPNTHTPTHGWGSLHRCQIFTQNWNISIYSKLTEFLLKQASHRDPPLSWLYIECKYLHGKWVQKTFRNPKNMKTDTETETDSRHFYTLNATLWWAPHHLYSLCMAITGRAFSSGLWQWRIQDFPRQGCQLPRGAPTYDFAKFSRKLHEIERIWVPGGCPLHPP